MKRNIIQSLIEWKSSSSRKPLLLRGARQVGKTYVVSDFAKKHFAHFVKINFEKEPHLKDCFHSLDVSAIVQAIEVSCNCNLHPGSTLLFLDEIQDCPKAIEALRYFYEEFPQLHVIAAGSLLEFALTNEKLRMPVGRVEYLYLYPMTFSEMLQALDQHKQLEFLNGVSLGDKIPLAIHQQLLKQVQLYCVLGGMPEVVSLYAKHQKLLDCRKLQVGLLNTYRDDFGKYTSQVQKNYCERVFSRSFSLITKNIKYSDIDPDMDYRGLKQAIQLLFKANILTPIYYSNASGLPLAATQVLKKYKVLFLDLGLVQAAGRLSPDSILQDNIMQLNQGALMEQFVGQHLLTLQPAYDRAELFYWKRDKVNSEAEIDYLFDMSGRIIPIEVKSGKTGRLKSLRQFMQQHQSEFGIKLSTDEFNVSGDIWSLPLYLVEQLPRLLK